jgi:sugar O-acyltransferase (sialic acid O-acetyltransferase NeuD family)
MSKKIIIIGTGGFAREILCLISDLGRYEEVACFMETDDIWAEKWQNESIMGIPVRPRSEFDPDLYCVTIGIGNSIFREKVLNELPQNTEYITLIHPSVVISKWIEIGEGAIICAGSILTSQIKIGKQAQLNLHTTIGHDCEIGDFFTTAPGVNISGICNFGNHVYFGTSSAVRQNISICDNVTIGMGGMVVKNITEAGTYVGMPAKKLER